MALSEHEQQLLEQLEKQLRSEDPRFAQNISQSHSSAGITFSPKHLVTGILLMVAGLAVALAAIFFLTGLVAVLGGVVGFAIMVGGAYYGFAMAGSHSDRDAKPRVKTSGAAAKKSSGFMSRVEDRWDKRRNS